MKEKDLPIDLARHAVYTKKAKQCVLRLLHRDYDDQTCEQLWERIQLQYCEFLRDEPPMAGAKIKISIYDPILIFAWYKVVPDNGMCICHMDKAYSQGFRHIRYDRNSAVSEGARACAYRLRFDPEKD